MKRILFLIIFSFILSGCESLEISRPYPPYPTKQWYKNGVERSESRQKLAACRYAVGMNKVADTQRVELIRSCMEKDGFVWTHHPDDVKRWNQKVADLKRQGYRLYWPTR